MPDRETIITALRRFGVRVVYKDRTEKGHPRYAVFEGSTKRTESMGHREACDERDRMIADVILASLAGGADA